MTSIAVLGTGIMGAPMARNLASAGFDVRAWNRTRAKADPLAEDGIVVTDTAAEAADGVELVLTMLPDGDAVREVAEAALPAAADGAAWIQVSTIGPEAADALAGLAASTGVVYVDAPVSGTKQPAVEGTLVVLGSGPDDARERVQPVFDAIGAKTIWVGEAGKGSRLKLVVNTWLLAVVNGLADSVALAEGLGVDPALLLETIGGGPLDLPYAQLKGKAMIERSYDPSFTLSMAAKDAGLVHDAGRAHGLELPIAAAIVQQMEAADAAGHGDKDMAAVAEAVRPAG